MHYSELVYTCKPVHNNTLMHVYDIVHTLEYMHNDRGVNYKCTHCIGCWTESGWCCHPHPLPPHSCLHSASQGDTHICTMYTLPLHLLPISLSPSPSPMQTLLATPSQFQSSTQPSTQGIPPGLLQVSSCTSYYYIKSRHECILLPIGKCMCICLIEYVLFRWERQ